MIDPTAYIERFIIDNNTMAAQDPYPPKHLTLESIPKRIKAVSIGYLGGQWCFLGVTKEEALILYRTKEKCTYEDLEGLNVIEGYIIDGCFWNYDIGLQEEKQSTL